MCIAHTSLSFYEKNLMYLNRKVVEDQEGVMSHTFRVNSNS
jgi:hypothetical protein